MLEKVKYMYLFKDRFKSTQNTYDTIGLDIGSSRIKWVNLGADDELKHYAIEAITTPSGQKKDFAHIATILKQTLFEKDFIRNCVLNIPDNLVSSKWIQVDSAAYANLEETIKLLAEQSIPYPINKLYFDYQIFDLAQSQDKFKVLLVACHKEHLDFRLDIIQQANLIPVAAEVTSHALERAYYYAYPESKNENHISY
jgi:type IV pilus assembly protein PilM